MDSIKYQQIQNQNLTFYVRNPIMGRGWILHQDNDPKQTSKLTLKWVTDHKLTLLTQTRECFYFTVRFPPTFYSLTSMIGCIFLMKDKKNKQCRFIFTPTISHIYQGFQY